MLYKKPSAQEMLDYQGRTRYFYAQLNYQKIEHKLMQRSEFRHLVTYSEFCCYLEQEADRGLWEKPADVLWLCFNLNRELSKGGVGQAKVFFDYGNNKFVLTACAEDLPKAFVLLQPFFIDFQDQFSDRQLASDFLRVFGTEHFHLSCCLQQTEQSIGVGSF